MKKPKFVELFSEELEHQEICDIIFSEGAYQVQVKPKGSSKFFWPFLQLDEKGIFQDGFCSCRESDEKGYCIHLAAAYLAVFQQFDQPLHIRFKDSFFHRLCYLASKRLGFSKEILKKNKEDAFSVFSETKKLLFQITFFKPSVREKFLEFLSEEEEHSIKFSNLTAEQIKLWKENKAPLEIGYELSFWSDLAKWCLFLQDQKAPYKISFANSSFDPPSEIFIEFTNLFALQFYISQANWPFIITSLNSVESPLKMHEYEAKAIDHIFYDEEKKCFYIELKKTVEKSPSEEKKAHWQSNEWTYVPQKGFFSKKPSELLKQKTIFQDQIAIVLSQYPKTFQKYLKNTKIFSEEVFTKYHLFFDIKQNLHIFLFPFSLEDTKKKHASFFSPWFYLPEVGFYPLSNPLFKEIETVIEKKDVSQFIHRHRHFLQDIEGFHIHFRALPTYFSYQVTMDGDLKFNVKTSFFTQSDQILEFEEWIYIKDRGFYLKKECKSNLPIRTGLIIKKNEVSHFISQKKEELEQVEQFFSMQNPISKIGLELIVNKEKRILLRPEIQYNPGYKKENVIHYGDFVYVKGQGFYELKSKLPAKYYDTVEITPEQEEYFLTYEMDKIHRFISKLDRRIKKPKSLRLKINKVTKGRKRIKQFWITDLSYVSELGEVSLFEIWEGMYLKRNFSFSQAGLIALKQNKFSWLKNLSKRRVQSHTKLLKLTTLEWLRLCIFEKPILPRGDSPDEIETRRFLSDLEKLEPSRLMNTEFLKSNLRPYQEIGLQWLWFLYSYNLSGLLCDDMGLGKTHQAMALLSAARYENADQSYKYLVICPTSVIYHWEDLLHRFLPILRVLTYYGQERSLEKFSKNYDLLLTSYGILRTGKEDLNNHSFEIVIFDEVQIAKNARSQTNLALKKIRANMKLGLSGTPIENRLLELKSLFDLVLPSYLPNDAEFREAFIQPIEKNKDEKIKALLSRLIRPFILRRKKAEVLLDLPEKIEEIAYCDMSDEQKNLYHDAVESRKSELLQVLKNEKAPIPYLHVFSLLSKLKQICNHPSLFLGDIQHYETHTSGKWSLFIELVQEAINSGQKLVIFSQYLNMLKIIEKYLRKKKISFAAITGATKNRHQQIKKFKEDPKCEVFLASLLAAGVGIDLTAGSVVIHYDRWWNPAKENQATDRVHRIGQNRGVQVFKFVTRNTIEEHIHQLIEKKKSLMEELIGEDESDQIKVLSREELISILERTEKF